MDLQALLDQKFLFAHCFANSSLPLQTSGKGAEWYGLQLTMLLSYGPVPAFHRPLTSLQPPSVFWLTTKAMRTPRSMATSAFPSPINLWKCSRHALIKISHPCRAIHKEACKPFHINWLVHSLRPWLITVQQDVLSIAHILYWLAKSVEYTIIICCEMLLI